MEGKNSLTAVIGACFLGFVIGAPQDDITPTPAVPQPIIKSLHINSDIKYTYAKTWVSSRVLNPADVAQEVNFRVVLPEEAFITGLTLTIKDKSYDAYVKEKEEAKKDYDRAVSQGISAAHVFQESRYSKDFTVSVNVEPLEKVNFNLTYEELLSRKNKTYTNEINVNPNQIVDDLSVTINIEDILKIKDVEIPQFEIENGISTNDIGSSTAEKTILAPNKVKVEWKPSIEEQKKLKKEGLNGKMSVKYDVDTSDHPQTIMVDQDGYFVHILRNDDLPVLRKHVVFVLDVSGSMTGDKLMQLISAMEKILLDLSKNDFFSIVVFSDNSLAWGPKENVSMQEMYRMEPPTVSKEEYVVPASPDNVVSALAFVKQLDTYGGTNILGGVRSGLQLAQKGKQMNVNSTQPVESMVIFLTDGQPNVEESSPEKIIEKLGVNSKGVTIFSLGFGDDADMKFLKKLSLANNAFARKIYVGVDASAQLQNFYKEVASPVLSDVHFEYLPDQVENITSSGIKNLYSGSELITLGKIRPEHKLSGTLTAKTTSGLQRFEIPIDKVFILPDYPNHENKKPGYLEKMWAYKTIKSLLDKSAVNENKTIEDEAKKLALKYSFVTPLTSLVVVKPNDSSVVNDEKLKVEHGWAYGGPMSSLSAPAGGFGGFAAPAARKNYFLPTNFARVGSVYTLQALPAAMAPPPSLHYQKGTALEAESLDDFETDALTTTAPLLTTASSYTMTSYQNVTWLNATLISDQEFIEAPGYLNTTDVIALNEPNNFNSTCDNGNPCRHFIYCVLEEFSQEISKYLPYQCHIETRFLGICCPE